MAELKPCPFCGMPAKIKQDATGSWYLECTLCGVFKRYYKTKQFAIDAWNTRNGKKSDSVIEWVSVNDRLLKMILKAQTPIVAKQKQKRKWCS